MKEDIMIKVPSDIMSCFQTSLDRRPIPKRYQAYYTKGEIEQTRHRAYVSPRLRDQLVVGVPLLFPGRIY